MESLCREWPDPDRRDDALIRLACAVHSSGKPDLTPTQLRCIEAASHGLDARGIGEVIGAQATTVKTHLKLARRLLRAKNTTHACCEALRLGLIR